jgi:protein ImuB
MACIDLPAFPLQLLLRLHPEWHEHPAVVVDADKPQGIILWVNERARAFRILPGMRYAAGLALAGKLRAAEVPSSEIERATAALTRRLRYFTPHVEPASHEPGVFWLDASGLERLYESLRKWAGLIRAELKRDRLDATVVVGFNRFGTYALSKAKRGVIVLRNAGDERAATRRVPLDRLTIEPSARDALSQLGVRTVGAFADLPPEGIERRFGYEANRFYRLASGSLRVPLQPEPPMPPALQRLFLDHPEADVQRLMVGVERMLDPLLRELQRRGQMLTEIRVGFRFESRPGDHVETVRPAAPTSDAQQLTELIRLRLESLRKLPDGAVEILLLAKGTPATTEQRELFVEQPKRDMAAANRALARVRAELGETSVVRAQLREGHLPEGSFTWDKLETLQPAEPSAVESRRLVRRLHTRPIPLPYRPRQEPDGWILRGLDQGPVVRVLGPYVVAGGWWRRPVHREYHFAETQKGELLWVYYDRTRRRWYLHGRVE